MPQNPNPKEERSLVRAELPALSAASLEAALRAGALPADV